VNDTEVDAQTNISSYTHTLAVSDSLKFYKVLLIASTNSTSDTASFGYLIPQSSPVFRETFRHHRWNQLQLVRPDQSYLEFLGSW